LKGEDIGTADVICGGFPCQPFSTAGKRDGTKDDRHLWPEMLRLVEEIKPTWVIGENVAGFTSMVEQSRNLGVESRTCIRYEDGFDYEAVSVRQDELLLHNVCEDLSQIGYEVQPFIIPALAIDAAHRRDRLWLIAHSDSSRSAARAERSRRKTGANSSRCSKGPIVAYTNGQRCGETRQHRCDQSSQWTSGRSQDLADCPGIGCNERQCGSEPEENCESWLRSEAGASGSTLAHPECLGRRQMEQPISSGTKSKGATNQTQHGSFTRGRARWSPEPDVGRVAHGIPNLVDRLRGLGNAVVPGIPEEIGHAILTVEASLQDASIDK